MRAGELAAALGALLAALLAPARAEAGIEKLPGKAVDGIGDLIGGAGNAVGGAATGLIEDGFVKILELLFDEIGAELSLAIIRWLIEIPNFGSGSSVARLQESTQIMAFGLLGVVLVLAVARYMLSGVAGGSGLEVVQGLNRAVLAGLLIGAWPSVYRLVAELMNEAPRALLHTPGVRHDLAELLAATTVGGFAAAGTGIGLIIPVLIALIGALLLLVLLTMKVVITALTIVVAVAMPLALVLWPIPEFSWVARWLLRLLLLALAIPFIWVVIFASFAAIGADTFSPGSFGEEGILQEAIVRPLVALALLYLTIAVPRRLLQVVPMIG